jgi:predicted glycoside hydrolase/deacetylase ChbG (UPF0249 family)
MEDISLIIRADHFGLSHTANQAIEEGFEAGLLTTATLSGVGLWWREAVELARAHTHWEIGLDVQLHCDAKGCAWGPVCGRALVPSLVNCEGDFPTTLSSLATMEDIRKEMDAQINRALGHGIRPAYLECGSDSPLVDLALAEFSSVYGLPARTTFFGLRPVDSSQITGLGPGAYLWVVRPAQDSPETWAMWSDPGRHAADARAVCDPEIAATLESRGVRRCSFAKYLRSLS